MHARSLFAALFCLVGSGKIHAAVKLSNYVTQCSLKDPKLEECLTTQSKALLPYLVAGVKEWGIFPMDPFELPHLSLQNNNGNSKGFSINVTKTSHYGYKDMVIRSVRFNPSNYKFEMKLFYPTYIMHGQYEVGGQIILLPIQGTGNGKFAFKKLDVLLTMICLPETRGGKTYLKITNTTCEADVKHIDFKFENLFGNKQLSDSMNEILTENSLEVFKDFKTSLQDLISGIIEGILSRLFAKVSFDQFFKEGA